MEKFWRAAAPLDLHKSAGHTDAGGGGSPSRLTLSHMEKPWHHQSWVDVKQEVKKKKEEEEIIYVSWCYNKLWRWVVVPAGIFLQNFPSFETPQTSFTLAKEDLIAPEGTPCSCQECFWTRLS